jgi:hypothetical protein
VKRSSPQKIAKQILIGTMLGDSWVNMFSHAKANFEMVHASDQLEYLMWKMSKLYPLLGSFRTNIKEPFFKKNGVIKPCQRKIRAITLGSTYLRHVFDDFYFMENGKFEKRIRGNILNRLTPLSIAAWYMDDGSIPIEKPNRIHSVRLSTCGYPLDDSLLAIQYFKEKWNIEFKTAKQWGTLFSIVCRKREDIKRFLELVSPHIPSCMEYKVNPFLRNARHANLSREEIVRTLQQCKEITRNSNPSTEVVLRKVRIHDRKLLAEYFEKHGHIMIAKIWNKPSPRIHLRIDCYNEDIPKYFKECFGGYISIMKDKRNPSWRMFRYTASAGIARRIISSIHPYLTDKKEHPRVNLLLQ